jgi:hypothetical protein
MPVTDAEAIDPVDGKSHDQVGFNALVTASLPS